MLRFSEELKKYDKTILDSDNITAKRKFIKEMRKTYPEASPGTKKLIINIIFKMCRDVHDIVRLDATSTFSQEIQIPREIIMQTITKTRSPDFHFSTQPYIGAMDCLLTDALPLVRIAAIKALSFSDYKGDPMITNEIMKTAAQMLNDNSNIVRAAAAVALRQSSQASNTLFSIEKAQIRMIVAMLEDSLQINRQESMLLVQRLLVDDVYHAKLLITGMATAATKYPQDRPLFISSSQEFGRNNWYYFHLAALKQIGIIPNNIDLYSMETVVPFAALFAARKVHPFSLPESIAKYSEVIDSIIEGCSDSAVKEAQRPVNLNEVQDYLNDCPRNSKFFLYEVNGLNDAISMLNKESAPQYYKIENVDGDLCTVDKLQVDIIAPKKNTFRSPNLYTPNVNFFNDVIIKLSYPVENDLYVEFSSPFGVERFQLQKSSDTIYKASPKMQFFGSTSSFKVTLVIGFVEKEAIIPIGQPNYIWFKAI